MRRISTISVAIGLLAASTTAYAWTGDWDWEEGIVYEWTEDSINYAQDVIPSHPSPPEIVEFELEPPLEPWCFIPDPRPPTLDDCDIHKDMINDWTRELLGLDSQAPLPPELPDWKATCPSQCAG
jgi:hypothetical protein